MAKELKRCLVPIDKIVRPAQTQMRVSINTAKIDEYADERQHGARFPDIKVTGPGENGEYFLFDGFHTIAAYEKAGDKKIGCEIHEGGLREAILKATGCNASHGVPRTVEDKRKAVLTLLSDKEWGKKPQEWIAKQCNVRKQFVGDIKRDLKDDETRAAGGTPAPRPSRQAASKAGRGSSGGTESSGGSPALEPIKVEGCDQFGQVIPEDLKTVVSYANAGYLLAKAIRDHVAELKEFCATPGGVKVTQNSVKSDLVKAAEGIESGIFFAVCPECDGKAEIANDKGKAIKCPTCGGRGWIDKNISRAMPARLVKKLKEAAIKAGKVE